MKFDAVLFDCDGVLVDSEPITNDVTAGATVFGYAPQGQGAVLLRAGASQVFADMADLSALLV